MSRKLITAAAAATLALLVLGATQAQAAIVNGDFSNGLNGWTVGGQVNFADGAIYHDCCGTPTTTSPTFASFGGGNVTSLNTLSQSFATVVGKTYTLSFLSGALGGGVQDLSYALTGGANVSGTIREVADDSLVSTFSPTMLKFTATAASTTLAFSNNSFADTIDPVVTGVSLAAVPEPATWAMMMIGLAGLGAALRSRKLVAAAA
jgi:hypothetical protein